MKRHTYICCIKGEFVLVGGFDKSEAYMTARLLGYNGSIKDIRIYEE